MSFNNNFKIILGSKSKNFETIEAQEKTKYSYKDVCTLIKPMTRYLRDKYEIKNCAGKLQFNSD